MRSSDLAAREASAPQLRPTSRDTRIAREVADEFRIHRAKVWRDDDVIGVRVAHPYEKRVDP